MALAVTQNVPRFPWTKVRTDAAVLVAENALNDADIADRLGVSRKTLFRWRQHPEFSARVADHVSDFEASTLRYEITRRRRRVAALQGRWEKLQAIVEQRAGCFGDDAPGADTGLLVRQYRSIRSGTSESGDPEYETVTEWVLDAPLLKELRETEKQAAQEVGQWTEKREVVGPGGGPIEVVFRYVNDWRGQGLRPPRET